MNLRRFFRMSLLALAAIAVAIPVTSCSEERHPEYTAAVEVKDAYIDQLQAVIDEMQQLLASVEFGEKAGMYPAESRAILNNAIDDANRYILLIKYQNPAPSESEKARYLATTKAAIDKFKATIRTEDVEATPAYLYVDGRGTGADNYINFGHDEEYFNFGEAGKQQFTVELWVKVTKAGGKDQNVFLNTLVDGYGWSMYWRNVDGGVYRGTWGDEQGYCEPQIHPAPADGEWVYFAMTYSDTGLPGSPDLRAKLYVNGEIRATEGNVGGRTYRYNPFAMNNKPMTAFGRYMRLGDDMLYEEGFAGYMKKIRIWKEAKDMEYLESSYREEVEITGSEPNLVAAWNFTTKPDGVDNEIVDLTGRHTAKIYGNYKWERIISND